MPPRNFNLILIVGCISLLCYATHRRARTAMIVGDALDLINRYYVDAVDDKDLLIAAMNGMTSTLDQHSEYIPGDAYESFQNNMNQEFAGIGIYVDQPEPDNPVRVVTPLVGSPALQSGMLPGDEIIKIDGVDVSAMDLGEVSRRLKGPIQTLVDVVVRRDSKEVALSINRATIELESVIGDYRDLQSKWVYRLENHPEIAYVRLTSFGDKTVKELSGVLKQLDNQFEGLVLDLRGNSGGLLYSAVDVCNMLIESGEIVSTRTRGNRVEERFEAQAGTLVDPSKSVAILIDEYSASASEIVAACLQDNNRAAIVGTRSYGKGTVQNILPLQYGRSALRLTVARYYRPSGENIHRINDAPEDQPWGVKPSEGMLVTLDEPTREALAKRWREASYPSLASVETQQPSADAGEQPASILTVDPQLQRAVEYLKADRTRSAEEEKGNMPAAA